MAEKKTKLGVFTRTEGGRPAGAPDTSDLDEGGIQSTGVGLTRGEIAALDTIGGELGDYLQGDKVARNSLIRIAARRLIEAYRAGQLTPGELAQYFEVPERPKPRLKL